MNFERLYSCKTKLNVELKSKENDKRKTEN
jgi:hypothetical protein